MKKHSKASEQGFSVLEVIIVLAIIMIVATFAIYQMGSSNNQFKREGIAREFKVYLERSRFDSVRRRPESTDYSAMARVIVKSSTTYDVYYDMNQDGVIGSNEIRSIDFGQTTVKMSAGTAEFPITVRFDSRGHITTNSAGKTVDPEFLFCTGVCTELTTANSTKVFISNTGTVAMVGGDVDIDDITTPGTTTLAASDGKVNTLVTTVTPTPGTTVTPVATVPPVIFPTVAPTVEPTAGSTPVSTPTPTPTPRECVTGESTNTGCICSNPRKVNSSFNNQCQEPGNSQGNGKKN